jgi:hypothetical protein
MRWWIESIHFVSSKSGIDRDPKEVYKNLSPRKKIYMELLYFMKNKESVDSLTSEEFLSLFHLIAERGGR